MTFNFTPREQDVIDCLMKGHGTKGIARKLNIGKEAVQNYIGNIASKLDIDPYGRFNTHIRIIYLYAKHKKLLNDMWP